MLEHDVDSRPVRVEGGYQPQARSQQDQDQRGYQPQASKPVNIQNLKPPKGGSAIQPPKTDSSKPTR